MTGFSKESVYTTVARVSTVRLGLGLVGLGLAFRPAVCIYVECLYTRLQAKLAMCIALVFSRSM